MGSGGSRLWPGCCLHEGLPSQQAYTCMHRVLLAFCRASDGMSRQSLSSIKICMQLIYHVCGHECKGGEYLPAAHAQGCTGPVLHRLCQRYAVLQSCTATDVSTSTLASPGHVGMLLCA